MKIIKFFFIVSLFLAITQTAFANVFASGIKISDDTVSTYANAGNSWDYNFRNGGVKIWFIINESGGGALSAFVNIYSGAILVRTLNVPSPIKGVNSIIWDGYDNSFTPAPVGTYSFQITVTDPIGHSSFDSLWVAGAYYQGNDFDGGTDYAYRGNSTITDRSAPAFGNVYVGRGASSGNNGYYELRADGVFKQKIATSPAWPSLTPNDLMTIGEKIFGLAGYGYAGGGFTNIHSSTTNTFAGSMQWGNNNIRGMAYKINGTDTIYYTAQSGIPGQNLILKKVGVNGPTSAFFDMQPLMLSASTSGYIKSLVVSDTGTVIVTYGNSSTSRNKFAIIAQNGVDFYVDSLDGIIGLSSGAYFHSLALFHGSRTTIADDRLYALVYSPNQAEWGIYTLYVNLNDSTIILTKLLSPSEGRGTGSTSQSLSVDAVGNVIWANGNVQQKIMAFSPGSGANSYTTPNPDGYAINVETTVPVELKSFSASFINNNVELTWITSTETNNAGFEIERSLSGNWERIGFVKGIGTSSQNNFYSFLDKDINLKSKASYRLKQIDLDGSFKYSEAVEVLINIPTTIELSQNYPNPFNPETNINFRVPYDSKVKLQIFSLNGELVTTLLEEEISAGEHNVKFDASNLSSGTYLYRLSVGTNIVTKKMIVIK